MKKLLSCSAALALLLSFAHSASAKKRRKPFEEKAGDAGASLGVGFPITKDGNGFTLGGWGGYQLLDHLDATLSLSMAADEDSHVVMGNPVVSVGSSLWPTKMKRGWGASLNGRLNLGLGLFGIDQDQRGASALGVVSTLNWLSFLSEHLVVAPRLSGGLRLGSIFMGAAVAPQIAVPVHHTEGRDTEVAIRYTFSLGTGFGDHRGGLSFGIGMTGLSELTTEEKENRFTLDLGVGVRFRVVKQQGLRISAGLSIPLGGDFLGTSVIVGGNIGWGYSVEIEEEEDQAKEGGTTGWSAPYGIWPR
jgi:opacity protein-like surface antigen